VAICACPIALYAETPAAAPSAQPASDDMSAQVLAVSNDGKITVAQVLTQAAEMTRVVRNLQTFATAEELYKNAARQLALNAIFLKKASDESIEQMVGWSVAQKLIECDALAELLLDTTWSSVEPTQAELDQFAQDNPAVAHPLTASKTSDQSAGKPAFSPSDKDWLLWSVRNDKAFPMIDALMKDAQSRFPVQCVELEQWRTAADDDVVMRCGIIKLTRKDAKSLSELTGDPIEWCSQVYIINNSSESVLSMGELAREKGYVSKQDLQRYKEAQRKAWLADIGRRRIIKDMLDSYTPSEDEIKDYYDKRYKGVQEQMVKFEAIVCPVVVPAGATAEEQASAREKAKSSALEVINQIKQGASFDTVRTQHPEYRYMPPADATINPYMRSAFDQQMSVLRAGEIAPEPIEDYGGYCVMKAVETTPRQKMPLQYARGNIIDDLKFEHKTNTMTNIEDAILQKHGFAIQESVLARLCRQKGG